MTSEEHAIDNGAGVLSGLPRHRPGRPSQRRASARAATGASGGAGERGSKASASSTGDGKRKPAAKPSSSAKPRAKRPTGARQAVRGGGERARAGRVAYESPVPPQGYASEDEVELGKTVHPPTTIELVGSAVELVGEAAGDLARSGASVGGSLLRRIGKLVPKP